MKAMPIHDASGRAGDSNDLLFLDIDGVLHPVGVDYSFSSKFFSHLPLLEELLREFRSVDIVISSDWRLAEGIEQLQRYFSADIRHRIIGATPQIDPSVVVRHRRQLEIQAWLDGNGHCDAEWVALTIGPRASTQASRDSCSPIPRGRSIKTASRNCARTFYGLRLTDASSPLRRA